MKQPRVLLKLIFVVLNFGIISNVKCQQSSADYYDMAKSLYMECHLKSEENDKTRCAGQVVKYCSKALSLDDGSIDNRHSYVYDLRGKSYMEIKEYRKAINDFTIALDMGEYIEPKIKSFTEQLIMSEKAVHLSYMNRLLSYSELKEFDKVIEGCTYYIEEDKNEEYRLVAYALRSNAYLALGDIDKGLKDTEAAARLARLSKKEQEKEKYTNGYEL